MIAWLRNCIGAFKGYSGCKCCGDRWNWKPKAYFPYDGDGVYIKGEKTLMQAGGSMFAICAECVQVLKDRQQYQYCIWLVEKWICESPWDKRHLELRKRIVEQWKETADAETRTD